MNLQEILIRTAAQTGEDMLDDEARMLAVGYIAEAYEEMMLIYAPYIDIAALMPQDGILPREELGARAGRIVRVMARGMERPFDTVGEGVYVPGCGGAEAVFRCKHIPKPLTQDGDESELPQTYSGALADYASYRLMQGGGKARQQRGDAYYSRYLQRKAMLAPCSQTYRERLNRKYG